MRRFALALLIGISAAGKAEPATRSGTVPERPTSLVAALSASDFAEVYIIPPWISFVAAPRPDTVRLSGCKFFVSRYAWNGDTAEWRELEEALQGVEIEPAPSVRRRGVYFGLVLGDGKGTLREIYSDIWSYPPGKVFAFDQRQQVHLSERFAEALVKFAARHPELASGPPERCPRLDVPELAKYPPLRKDE